MLITMKKYVNFLHYRVETKPKEKLGCHQIFLINGTKKIYFDSFEMVDNGN